MKAEFTDKEIKIIHITFDNMGFRLLNVCPEYIKYSTLQIHKKWVKEFEEKGIFPPELKQGLVDELQTKLNTLSDKDLMKENIKSILGKINNFRDEGLSFP